jgi:integrase
MARMLERLTALQVRRAGAGWHHDGGQLYLKVHSDGSRLWFFRYGPQGRRYLSLGPTHTIALAAAREKAAACRALLVAGRDPLAERNALVAAAKIAAARNLLFDAVADAYCSSHRAAWRSEKYARNWLASLRTHASPAIGALPVGQVNTALVLRVLEPIWTTKPVTAGRVRQRIEVVLDWAKARGHREGENPARWRGHLDHLLPPLHKLATVKHLAALPYDRIPAFMAKLRAEQGAAARCLELITLTAVRLNEAVRATWDEIVDDVWVIPAARMKGGREHRVPLVAATRAIFDAMRKLRRPESTYVFATDRGRPIDSDAVWLLVKRIGGDSSLTVHGLRSSFRDWVEESTSFPPRLAEMALAHVVGGETERAYRRADVLEKRRKLMAAWARHCASVSTSSEVIPLRGRRHG